MMCFQQKPHTHTHRETPPPAHSHTHTHPTHVNAHNFPENNDSCAWGRIVCMPGAVHWYQVHETWRQRISYQHRTRLRDTAISARDMLQSQECCFAPTCYILILGMNKKYHFKKPTCRDDKYMARITNWQDPLVLFCLKNQTVSVKQKNT